LRLLLDTTVLIDAARSREPAHSWLQDALRQSSEIGVCAVTVSEFFAGLRPEERPRWEAFVDELTFWGATRAMAKQAGIYRYEYARRGRTILIADSLIAATAIAVGAAVVTDNVKDFPMPEITTIQLGS
jgi:predicted nucleic acid-binding protein